MNPVVHFEIPYDDPARAAKFYLHSFGWQIEAMREKLSSGVRATHAATVDDRRVMRKVKGGSK